MPIEISIQSTDEIPMPLALAALVAKWRAELIEAGQPAGVAKSMALRIANHAGWYRTAQGWKQLAQDVRDKVNVRRGDLQPDGTYLIRDIDGFYPNAVKPGIKVDADGVMSLSGTQQYTADDIKTIMENSNRAVNSGGQKAALTRGHPSEEQKGNGISIPSLGQGINWRESPRGKGWMRFDLASVDPDLFNDWRKRKITGLSLGFVKDAHGLNRRVGHIAALGAESQALSALPITEVFSVADQVCFSAEPAAFLVSRGPGRKFLNTLKGAHMKMSPKQAGALKDCYSAFAAALSSYEAGEPDSDAKLEEAKKALQAKQKEFGAEEDQMGEAAPPTETGSPAGAPPTPPSPMAVTPEPAAPPAEVPGEYEAISAEDFASEPEGTILKSIRNQTRMARQLTSLSSKYATSEKENRLLRAKASLDKFSAELQSIAEDHEIETDMYVSAFTASGGNAEEAAKLLAKARSRPRKMSPSRAPSLGLNGAAQAETFSAQEDDKAVAARLGAEVGGDFSVPFAMLGMGSRNGSAR